MHTGFSYSDEKLLIELKARQPHPHALPDAVQPLDEDGGEHLPPLPAEVSEPQRKVVAEADPVLFYQHLIMYRYKQRWREH